MRPRTIVWLVLIIAAINLGLGIWMPDTSTRTTISSILLGVIRPRYLLRHRVTTILKIKELVRLVGVVMSFSFCLLRNFI